MYRTREHLENLFDYANAPIIVWDTDFRITRFNHAFERLTGLRAEDVMGRPLDILFPEASRVDSLSHIKRTLAGERWEVVEIPILRTDGAVRTVLWNSANIYDKDGTTLTATIAQGQDITERKQAEEGLRRNEATLRGILNATQESIWLFSPDGITITANETALRRFGKPAEEVVGRHMTEILTEELGRSRLDSLKRVVASNQVVESEDQRSGMLFHHSWYPVQDDQGQVTGVVSFSRDITELKQAEAGVRYQAQLLGQVQDGIIGADPETRITYWNKGAERMFGFTEAEALGKTTVELLRPEYAPGEREKIMSELARLGASRLTIRVKHKNGADVMAEVHSTRLTDESGATSGYVVAYRDVTERKRMEEETRRLASFPLLNPQPVVEVDAAGRVSFANPAARSLFPDLERLGPNHPWLADWADLSGSFSPASSLSPLARSKLGSAGITSPCPWFRSRAVFASTGSISAAGCWPRRSFAGIPLSWKRPASRPRMKSCGWRR